MDIVTLNSAITKVANLQSIATTSFTETSIFNKVLISDSSVGTTINLISEIESGES